MPHPHVAIEISPERIAGARWTRTGSIDNFTVEPLPPAALIPSAVETNVVNLAAVNGAFAKVVGQLRAKGEDAALLLPDPVIRVFVQHFDEFPRSSEEAEPMLRWKLMEESIIVSLVVVVFLFHFRSSLVAILTLPLCVT